MPLRLLAFIVLGSTALAAVAAAPSFKRDIAPLLEERCSGCHLTGQEQGQMALTADAAYGSLVGHASVESPLLRVRPEKPDESYLVRKLEGTHLDAGGKGARMPLGESPLDLRFIALLRQWITAGAAND